MSQHDKETDGHVPLRLAPQTSEVVEESNGSTEEPVNREEGVWRQWLESMASDSESALAAAMAYREMSGEQRAAMITSLMETGSQLGVPLVAIFAPLLAVEEDPSRRLQLESALVSSDNASELLVPHVQPTALWSVSEYWRTEHDSQDRLLVFILPLYLNFVQVLAVEVKAGTLGSVRHDPILNREQAPQPGERLDGQKLEKVPLSSAMDILAQCIVVSHRNEVPLPDALRVVADWLNPVSETPPPSEDGVIDQ